MLMLHSVSRPMSCEQRLCSDAAEFLRRCFSISDVDTEYVPAFHSFAQASKHVRTHNLPDFLPSNPTDFQAQILKYVLRNMSNVLS